MNSRPKPSGLQVKDVSYAIQGTQVLHDVSLNVRPGEIVLLAGKSGVGKSVLLSLISGYRKLRAEGQGRITYEGVDLLQMAPQELVKYVTLIAQNARLSFCMQNLHEELIFCLENLDVPAEVMEDMVRQTAAESEVLDILGQSFDSLSGGELQRAAFACARLLNSHVILMDEPFSNLDQAHIRRLQADCRTLAAANHTLLVVDHRLDLWTFVNRILLLGAGGEIIHEVSNPSNLDEHDQEILAREGLIASDSMRKPSAPNKPSAPPPLLELRDFSLTIGKKKSKLFGKILDPGRILYQDVNLSIGSGELIALVGASGSGKSNLFYALLGQLPYEGSLTLAGEEVRAIKKHQLFRQVGLVFQDPSLQFLKLDVLTEIRSSYEAWGQDVSDAEILDFLAAYKLADSAKKSPWLLSQGQQRRLAVLTMVTGRQKILLIDEPTYGQDYAQALQIMKLLAGLSQQGITVIFTSHDERLVEDFAERIFLIENQGIREIAPANAPEKGQGLS